MAAMVSVILVGVLALVLVSVVLLVAFSYASRRDCLGTKASTVNTRWARRVSGVYTRGDHEDLVGR